VLRRLVPNWPGMLIAAFVESLAARRFGMPIETIGSCFGELPHVCVPKTLNPTVMVMKSAQDGTERMTPARCTKRETGASLSNDRCVLSPL
jgi:hypothetical protein